MKKLVSDEDFNGHILDGLLRRNSGIDLVRATEPRLQGIHDTALLAWATEEDRIVLSHDRKSMVPFATARISSGESIAGLIVVSQSCPTRQAIEEILLVLECYPEEQWRNYVQPIPL